MSVTVQVTSLEPPVKGACQQCVAKGLRTLSARRRSFLATEYMVMALPSMPGLVERTVRTPLEAVAWSGKVMASAFQLTELIWLARSAAMVCLPTA